MRKISLFIYLFISLLTINALSANTDPVAVMKNENNKQKAAVMYQAVDGLVKLFYEPTEIIEYEDISEEGSLNLTAHNVDLYYIGTDLEVEAITVNNYKRLVKQYLPNATELHRRLGKRGFRFENLPSMVLYYNKRVNGKATPLTKSEINRLFISN